MTESLPDPANTPEKILILDFGSQVTQLIARRLREIGCVLRNLAIQRAVRTHCDMATEGRDPVGRPGLGA